MKSKRRHELQTNELADQLGHWIERVRPYTTMAIIVALGAVLVLAAWYYLAASHEQKLAESWRSLMLAGANPQGDVVEELSQVADRFEAMPAGLWAALTAADLESSRGVRLLFSDRAAAETSLNQAKGRYREVLAHPEAARDTLLVRRAQFGLAQVCEAQSELEEAQKHYQQVAASSEGTTLATVAQQRAKRLEQAQTKKWYNWFANQRPAPRDLGGDRTSTDVLGLPESDLGTIGESPSPDFLRNLGTGVELPDAAPAAKSNADSAAAPEAAGTDVPLAEPPAADSSSPAPDVPPLDAPGR